MKLIFLYGPPAAGKYTLAKALATQLDFKLFHNHLTVDLLKSVFTYGTADFFHLSEKIRLDIFEAAAKQQIPGVVFTFVYEHNSEDDAFIHKVIEVVESNGGEVIFIQIYCEQPELLKRVTAESRREFQKIKSPEGLAKLLATNQLMETIPFVQSTKIDTTHLSVSEALDQVIAAL